jgi:hypothetical protein
MKKELNYLASKSWVKVRRQEWRSTPYKQEIHPGVDFLQIEVVERHCAQLFE